MTMAEHGAVYGGAVEGSAVDSGAVNDRAVDGAGAGADAPEDGLLSRLRLIEDQPLDQRSVAYAQIYDGLQSALEGGDSSPRHA
jgi:hypothetical protein